MRQFKPFNKDLKGFLKKDFYKEFAKDSNFKYGVAGIDAYRGGGGAPPPPGFPTTVHLWLRVGKVEFVNQN